MALPLPEETHVLPRHAVIPTPLRLGADLERSGRGVTLALLDSGFYPHPDLLRPRNRVLAFHDVTGGRTRLDEVPDGEDWHGTQTAVVAAGSGYLSGGVYRGIAWRASLVLVKVGDGGRITEENLARALEWVTQNRERYGIRVVSVSLGGDADLPLEQSRVNQAAEAAVAAGIVVVAAAGNSGGAPDPRPVPPATAPSVLAVGGWDDDNELDDEDLELYHSSYGWTADGLVKPEILAPAMWVAAPLLPGTELARRAEVLARLDATPDYLLPRVAAEAGLQGPDLRAQVDRQIRRDKLVSAHYQHVDGTSFAAPAVASVVAQMLEANPRLTPAAVRQILLATAKPLDAPRLRQGYGAVQAAAAVRAAGEWRPGASPLPPQAVNGSLTFTYYDPDARSVALAGDFTGWQPRPMEPRGQGTWMVHLPRPEAGLHRYKIVLDGSLWLDDPGNPWREDDGFGGLNSLLEVGP